MYKIIQRRKIWFTLSAIFIIPGIVSLFIWGLNLGIDFTGGAFSQISFIEERPTVQEVDDSLVSLELGELVIQPAGENDINIRLKHIDNETYQIILTTLEENFGEVEEKSFESIGPTIGQELKEKAYIAIAIVLIFIIIYISFAFRKVTHGPVKSWAYGLAAIVALVHDILIVTGIFSILGYFLNVEINILFVTALLTVLGFSVHDSIVVFDRIREGLKLNPNKSYEIIVNDSINQTIIRSINTSVTTLLVLGALYLLGGQSIKYFILALIIGIISGTYSSIFIASPILVVWNNFKGK